MADIYSEATQVAVWLDGGDHGSSGLMQCLKGFSTVPLEAGRGSVTCSNFFTAQKSRNHSRPFFEESTGLESGSYTRDHICKELTHILRRQ